MFIPLGSTLDEAILTMNQLKTLYSLPRKETTQITGRFSALYPDDNPVTVTVTSRKIIFTRMLEFSLPDDAGGLVRATYIYKNDFSSLLTNLKIYKVIHPKD